ncbi:hypothetical protein F4860DRAFT_514050 [Xylaria cubensis]|nr:hypothetical protein F4860DRAFT_514050 [Xylaria cubensis]
MAPPQHAGLGRPNLSAMKKNDTPHPSTVRHTLERSSLGSSQVIGFRTNDARDESARRVRLATTLSGGINKTTPGRALSSNHKHPLISQATARIALGDQFNHLNPSHNRRTEQADIETNAQEPLPQQESERTRKLRLNLEDAIRYLRRSGGNVPPAYLQTRQQQDPIQPTGGDLVLIEHLKEAELARSRDNKALLAIPAPGNAEPNIVPYTISEDFSDQQRMRTQEMKLLALTDRQEIPIRPSII